MSTEDPKLSQTDPRVRRIAISAAIVLAAFLIGSCQWGSRRGVGLTNVMPRKRVALVQASINFSFGYD